MYLTSLFEVSGLDVSELAFSSSKIFFTSSEASPRRDDNFVREERSISRIICAYNCSLFFKMAGKRVMKASENSMKTGDEFVLVNRCAINL